MGNIVVTEFMSIDGVVEAPGGEPGYAHTGWVFPFEDEAQIDFKFNETRSADALLLGRKTYESFAAAWPAFEGEFGDVMNAMPKFVASTTLASADWNNSTVLKGDLAAAVLQVKRDIPGDILVPGSRSLVNWLKGRDLVDEYRLTVFPVVLGSGFRLFAETPDAHTLAFRGAHTLPNGTVTLTYRRQPREEPV